MLPEVDPVVELPKDEPEVLPEPEIEPPEELLMLLPEPDIELLPKLELPVEPILLLESDPKLFPVLFSIVVRFSFLIFLIKKAGRFSFEIAACSPKLNGMTFNRLHNQVLKGLYRI